MNEKFLVERLSRSSTYSPILPNVSHLAEKHTFSSKERDVETGLSYFGARYYSSELSIWLSVDPMSDKYPSMSPYVYCANNPVKLVDPNGEEIVIEWKGSQYQYMDGNLILVEGTELSEKEMKKFVNKVTASLNKINQSEVGKRMIGDLQNSTSTYVIKANSKSSFDEKEKIISWCANGILLPVAGTPMGKANGTFDLAHELSHAYDDNNNWTDRTEIEGLDKNEWVACYRENLIRAELNESYRTYYRMGCYESSNGNRSYFGGTGPSLLKDKCPYLPFKLSNYEKN